LTAGESRTEGLDLPLRYLKGVGPAKAEALAEAGYRTAADLLENLPIRYEDRRHVSTFAATGAPGTYTFRAAFRQVRLIRTRKRNFTIVRGLADDGTGSVVVTWFNQPYLARQIEINRPYFLHGTLRKGTGSGFELLNPAYEAADTEESNVHTDRVVPVYRSIGGIGAPALRRIARSLLDKAPASEPPDPFPRAVLERRSLLPLPEALRYLHAPPRDAELADLNGRRTSAHARLIYGELLELQLELALLRQLQVREEKQHRYSTDERAREVARAVLPFALTGAQKRVLREIAEDLRSPYPMLRLLQGDVGAGKTMVAALALVLAMESGLQGAFMAPTELLAEQHFANLRRLLGSRYRIALLTASAGNSAVDRRALARGEAHLAVGTHALIQQSVEFKALGLAVIDEQHRFGVEQRQLLQRKGDRPDVLVMTATPIPRTLALTAYGDLETSVLDEMPPGRTPIATEVLPNGSRKEVYKRLREELDRGARAYVVFPLIDESEAVTAASVAEIGEKVRQFLAPHPSAVLHGRVPAVERERVMADFAAGRIRILVATTVIEVGVDVPEATWMVIESAERFGLAQLHQLRGRVGRGTAASRCIALHGALSEEGEKRLKVFAESQDGFRIAEADLEIRGPGDLLGTRQSGLPTLKTADLVADRAFLEMARDDAREILERWREPEWRALRERIEPRVKSRYERFAGG
jgi:ATP-dependent DNA helicase RecG